MSLTACLVVMVGGALGTLLRFLVSYVTLPISRELPWGTILINITGSFIIGFFGTLTLTTGRYPVAENWRLFVMVGLCGGFTTFSAFSPQTLDLMRSGAMARAGVNVALSVALCIAAVTIGHVVASRFNDGAIAVAQTALEEEA